MSALAGLAQAQGEGTAQVSVSSPEAGGKSQRLEWPRTFTGQSDFVFTRLEIMQEAALRAQRDDVSAPAQVTVLDLLNDETKFDPLGLNKRVTVSSTVVVSGTAISGTVPRATLMEKLMANAVQLPTFNVSYTTDLTEYKSMLRQTISNTVAGWKPNPSGFSYGGMLDNLVLQAVVTSPQRYAVINGHRYGEGGAFQLNVSLSVPDEEVLNALNAKVPSLLKMPPALQEQYQQAYEEVITDYAKAREANPAIGRQQLSMPVTVVGIQPRKVLLEVNGEQHELTVRFAY